MSPFSSMSLWTTHPIFKIGGYVRFPDTCCRNESKQHSPSFLLSFIHCRYRRYDGVWNLRISNVKSTVWFCLHEGVSFIKHEARMTNFLELPQSFNDLP